ncbi:MAG TPA: 16S rRNA (cytosine(1402)-N(4))-methyltransferase RsmH [Spirochaetota bacterium]|nr:16S rRNA (cytosine(1402)-N(4))-methyltransferase RsmH [Spirochaetota bacterium]HOM37580.1 16S rRNA (cytosine(1402)-N(4))-methyltransferase RsmH [Spirochaetota bacterium]HPQ49449.1 16S rRNA (cytosine(1402)-N(4))-methyltransferase RsmH [Spirochaetota bacterium]
MFHIPVLLEKSLELLLKKKGIYVDLTTGEGGHSKKIAESSMCEKLICFDRDPDIQRIAKNNLSSYDNIIFINENFANIKNALKKIGIDSVDGILADLGLSMYHYRESQKGFSFMNDMKLDMSLDNKRPNAYDVVNSFSEKEIADIIYFNSDEIHSKKIAREIVSARKIKRIETTKELADIIKKAIGKYYNKNSRIHPATKTFQALRIFVNNEIENLKKMITDSIEILNTGGRIVILTYHSIEDRVVKNMFKQFSKISFLKIITKKPIIPDYEEIKINPSARSAKLRAAEKMEVLKCQNTCFS